MLIDDYSIYLKAAKGRSDGTIEQYRNSVNLFNRYMKSINREVTKTSIKKVKLTDIYEFLASITKKDLDSKKDNKCSNNSRRNKISALKSFFKYCKSIGLLKINITLEIETPPADKKKIRKYFDLTDCKKLIDSVGKRNMIRDKTIIIVFLNTGLRLEELSKLNTNCIEISNFKINGKGNKDRELCFNPKTIEVIKEYLLQRPKSKSDALFLSERMNRMSESAIQYMMKETIERAGLNPEHERDVLVHILRRSFATNEYQSGTDLNELKELMGHADIGTTQIYIRTSEEQMKKHAQKSIMQSII